MSPVNILHFLAFLGAGFCLIVVLLWLVTDDDQGDEVEVKNDFHENDEAPGGSTTAEGPS